MIRMGVFGAHYTLIILRNPQSSLGNYYGPILECLQDTGSWGVESFIRVLGNIKSHTTFPKQCKKPE